MAKTAIKSKREPEDQEDAPPSKKAAGGKSGRSLADKFNAAPVGGGPSMPPGKHQCAIISFELQENAKGTSAVVEYEGRDNGDDDIDGKKLKQWYKLFDEKDEVAAGAGFLKADLATLGYEDVTFDDLEAAFKEITREEPMVVIQVKQNGQYTNAYLQGLVE